MAVNEELVDAIVNDLNNQLKRQPKGKIQYRLTYSKLLNPVLLRAIEKKFEEVGWEVHTTEQKERNEMFLSVVLTAK